MFYLTTVINEDLLLCFTDYFLSNIQLKDKNRKN